MRLRLNKETRAPWWIWSGCIGLALVLVVVFLVLVRAFGIGLSPTTTTNLDPFLSEQELEVEQAQPSLEVSKVAVETEPSLPHLDYPPGSVEEACGLNEFPSYWNGEDEDLQDWNGAEVPTNEKGEWRVLESEECQVALENHINSMNPYLFLWGEEFYQRRALAFIVLDNPLTFERIFADPTGDLLRVQNALSRPECLLKEDESNWELVETCHAEAFLNYALINRFCFDDGLDRRGRTYVWENPTPEEDRFMWKQDLENEWLRKKCEAIDPALKLTEHSELYQKSDVEPSVLDPIERSILAKGWISVADITELSARLDDTAGPLEEWVQEAGLIELSARLGDDTAGVIFGGTKRFIEKGYKYGRFSRLLTSDGWQEFAQKRQPAADRFLQTFNMLAIAAAHRPDPRDEIDFDWELIARHLCEPPYNKSKSYSTEEQENPESKSCREVVHELRRRDIKFAPLQQTLDKFEQVAIELGVYE